MQKFIRVITLLGSTSVGKSTLVIRLTENRFEKEYDPTIMKKFNHRLTNNGSEYELDIYDTAGLEQHSQINGQFINSDGFILVYSIADPQSFQIVKDIFYRLADELNKENIPIVLIGNKSDLTDQRRVGYSEGEKLAKSMNAAFFETSAFNGNNVVDVFVSLLNIIDPPTSNHMTRSPSAHLSNGNSNHQNGSIHSNNNNHHHQNQHKHENVNSKNTTNNSNKSCTIS